MTAVATPAGWTRVRCAYPQSNADVSDWRQLTATIGMPSGDFAPDPSALARRVERHFNVKGTP